MNIYTYHKEGNFGKFGDSSRICQSSFTCHLLVASEIAIKVVLNLPKFHFAKPNSSAYDSPKFPFSLDKKTRLAV